MPKIAHIEDKHDHPAAERSTDKLLQAARETAERGAEAARESLQLVQTAADVAAEQQGMARQLAENLDELGRVGMDLLTEQTRHNLHVATAFGRIVNWGALFEAQRDFIGSSFGRMNQFNERYREIVQVRTKPTSLSSRA